MDIRFVPHTEIDKVKWNSCIHYAPNGNVFGYKWFLDNVAPEWDALVEGDYESVFPLVWRSNFLKRKSLYQPIWIRELGLFSIHVLSEKRMKYFFEAIPDDFKNIQQNLNERMNLLEHTGFKLTKKTNYQLLLSPPYEILAEQFRTPVIEWIKKAESVGLRPSSNLKPETIADFFKKHSPDRKDLTRRYHASMRLMYNVLHRGLGFASGVINDKKELCAAAFFIYSHGKILRLISAESPEGKELGAFAFQLELLLRTHARRPLILDFNIGEEEKRLAEGFGARANHFYEMQRKHNPLF